MAGPYYCDLAGTYADVTALTGAKGSGPGGLQAIIRGTGNATALAAGETVYLKGTGNLTRLVTMDLGVDCKGWGLGDSVRNKDGAGDDWTGLVCQVSVGADDNVVLIELAVGDDIDNIADADGIENTSAGGGGDDPTSVDPLPNTPLCPGIQIDTNAGTAESYINFIGTNSSWTNDGTLFKLDGNGDATNCITGSVKHISVQNFDLDDATGHGFTTSGEPWYWVWLHGITHNHGSGGLCLYHHNASRLILTQAYSNGSDGFQEADDTVQWFFCVAHDNTESGFNTDNYNHIANMWYGCLSYSNTEYGFERLGAYSVAINCVAHDNGKSGITVKDPNPGTILGCRITSNGTEAGDWYGIDGWIYNPLYGWNYITGNDLGPTTGTVTAIVSGGVDTNLEAGTDGYTNAGADDYNLAASATLRNTAIELD